MLKKIFLYSLLAIFAYLGFLIANLPASVVWQYARPYLPLERLPVKLSPPGGTLWAGHMALSYQDHQGELQWRLTPWRLLTGDSPLQAQFRSDLLRLDLDARWAEDALELRVRGNAPLASFNQALKPHGVSVEGTLDLPGLEARIDPRQQRLLDLKGSLHWSGGNVGYPMGMEMRHQQMPGLVGLLGLRGNDIVLDIKENPAALGLAEVLVQQDGIARVAVRRALLDLAGAPWSAQSSAQDVVFRAQQRLF